MSRLTFDFADRMIKVALCEGRVRGFRSLARDAAGGLLGAVGISAARADHDETCAPRVDRGSGLAADSGAPNQE